MKTIRSKVSLYNLVQTRWTYLSIKLKNRQKKSISKFEMDFII
mgnify:CR=1 FL=1